MATLARQGRARRETLEPPPWLTGLSTSAIEAVTLYIFF
jgi:hypothetical protein